MNCKRCLFDSNVECVSAFNHLKTRDDRCPVCFVNAEKADKPFTYKLCEHFRENRWVNNVTTFDNSVVRDRIEPWLTSLFQSEHLSLLLGAGFSKALCLMASENGSAIPSALPEFSVHNDKISTKAEEIARCIGRANPNFEDQLRVANELLQGLKILQDENADRLEKEINNNLSKLIAAILKDEETFANAEDERRRNAFTCLVEFLMSFASRTGTRDRLQIYTTNYDRFIETGADLAGLHLLDRFVGALSPIFRASRFNLDMHYNPPGIRGEPRYLEGVVHFTKLHGSLDWVDTGDCIRKIGLPFGAQSKDDKNNNALDRYLNAPGFDSNYSKSVLIYPNASKDVETSEYPYVELFRDFSAGICRPNSTLVTYGYSFGDGHINRVIEDMLTIPSTHLVIISYDDSNGRIFDFYQKSAHSSQISLIIGANIADMAQLTRNYLPKASIDYASTRMGEILKSRINASYGTNAKETNPTEEQHNA